MRPRSHRGGEPADVSTSEVRGGNEGCGHHRTLTSPELHFAVGDMPLTFEVEAGASRFGAKAARMRVSHDDIQIRQTT